MLSSQDQNQNGIPDSIDIVNGARQEVEKGTVYDGSYFQGGYPPESRGACADVITPVLTKLNKPDAADTKTGPKPYPPHAMLNALIAMRVENMSTFTQLVERLTYDPHLRYICGFEFGCGVYNSLTEQNEHNRLLLLSHIFYI